jgi:hypothetical protein
MFDRLTIRGTSGTIQRSYLPAVVCRSWAIRKERKDPRAPERWTLRGMVERLDKFQVRQTPLEFVARLQAGMPPIIWRIDELVNVTEREVIAVLRPPECDG